MSYQLQFSDILPYTGVLIHGVAITLELTGISTVVGISLGILGGAARAGSIRWLSALVGGYVELIRNTPFIVQLFFIFFGLPGLGIKLSAFEAAIIAMVVNLAAYSTEIMRAGIQAINRGQIEAGLSLAMSRTQVFIHVVLKPALAKIYPALTSQCIIEMLGSAVVSQISAPDLTFAANYIESRTFRSFEIYLVATVIYLCLALIMRQSFRLAGVKWLGRSGR